MLSQAELAAQTAQTRAFIEADPSVLAVTPPAQRVSDGAGGWIQQDGAPYVIVGRLVPQSDKVPVLHTSEGDRPNPEFVLVCMPGTRMPRYSTFFWEGAKWRIDKVHLKPEYEVKGDVSPDGG